MRSLFLSVMLFTIMPFTHAQKLSDAQCGSIPDEQSIALIDAAVMEGKRSAYQGHRTVTSIPVRIWWMTDSSDTQSITPEMLDLLIEEANAVFAGAHLSFFQCFDPETLISSEFVEFTLYEESSLRSQHYTEGLINLYVFNSITAFDGTPLCGYAKFPGSSDMIFMDKECLMDGSTLNHEFGHFFGLYHTHGLSNANPTNELVNGANCTVAGDDVCDTPADPNLKEEVNSNCIYTGNALDGNGDPYLPDPMNLMCYAPAPCRQHFSVGQLERIDYVHRYLRSYLTCSQLSTEFDITADNDMCSTSATASGSYAGNATQASISWDIDDDETIDYTGPSFTHTYTEAGDYTITMYLNDHSELYSKRMHHAVQVFDQLTLPVNYDFERPGQFQYNIENPDQDHTWYETRIDPQSDHFCLSIDNYHNYQRGEEDAFILPPLQLDGQTFAFLSFQVAYAYAGLNYEDELEVLVSEDCGLTYQSVYHKVGSELSTIEGTVSEHWMPQGSSDWRNETIDLTAYLGKNILIKFRNINDFGNHLYIDQIQVDGDEVLASDSFTIQGKKIKDGLNRIRWSVEDQRGLVQVWLEGGTTPDNLMKLTDIQSDFVETGTFDHHFPAGQSFYYRLAGTDNKNEIHYSHIISITDDADRMILIYPNPVQHNARLRVQQQRNEEQDISWRILNQQGIECLYAKHTMRSGIEELTLPTDRLPAGLYWIQLEIGGAIYHERFVKQ